MHKKKDSEISPVPFLNIEFLKSPAARTIRILAEYLEPAERLRRAGIRDTIGFFGSARSPSPEQADELISHIKEEIERARVVSAELEDARRKAVAAVRLALSYLDGVELSTRLTKWTKLFI